MIPSPSIKALMAPPATKGAARSPSTQPAKPASALANRPPPGGEFPQFADGDTLIILAPSRIYQLHSNVLRRSSTFFADLLAVGDKEKATKGGSGSAATTSNSVPTETDEDAEKSTAVTLESGQPLKRAYKKKYKGGVKFRVNFEPPHPDTLEEDDENAVGIFILEDPSSRAGRRNASTAATALMLSGLSGGNLPKLYARYDTLFRAYYSLPLHLTPAPSTSTSTSTTVTLPQVLSTCMGLITVAEAVGSVPHVSESVDIALLRQGQILYRAIASNAPAWAGLGMRVRSPTIFHEAVVHLVGQWNALSGEQKRSLDGAVHALCESKARALDVQKMATDVRLLGHYPATLLRAAAANPGRLSYSNDIYMWMTTCLFRQWFSQSVCEGRGRGGSDGGATLYRQVGGVPGYAYLERGAMEGFHRYFPMSGKGWSCVEAQLAAYKEEVRGFVEGLLRNESQVDVVREGLPYLTCAVVREDEFPWVGGGEGKRGGAEGGRAGSCDSWDSRDWDEWEAEVMDGEEGEDDGGGEDGEGDKRGRRVRRRRV